MKEERTVNALERLQEAGRRYPERADKALLERTAKEGQHPYAIVICCSDSRVIPEQIFSADVGDLFVIRVAGNVIDRHQLGSIEYAAEHLGCGLAVVLGHTGCGAVAAALSGHSGGFVTSVTDEIRSAIGMETDPDRACRLNVRNGIRRIRSAFRARPKLAGLSVVGAIYDVASGTVEWL